MESRLFPVLFRASCSRSCCEPAAACCVDSSCRIDASSLIVLSPRTASNATLALHAPSNILLFRDIAVLLSKEPPRSLISHHPRYSFPSKPWPENRGPLQTHHAVDAGARDTGGLVGADSCPEACQKNARPLIRVSVPEIRHCWRVWCPHVGPIMIRPCNSPRGNDTTRSLPRNPITKHEAHLSRISNCSPNME